MRTLTKSIAVVLVAGAAIWSGIVLSACAPKSEPPVRDAVAYNPDKTQGDVRVVLLRVARLTVFTDKWHSDPGKKDLIAAPAFAVTYLVEVPKSGAFSGLVFQGSESLAIFSAGKKINGQVEDGLIQGSRGSSQGFKDTAWHSDLSEPVTPDGRAAIVQEEIFKGLKVGARSVDLKIRFQWNGNDMVFDFKDVPLN